MQEQRLSRGKGLKIPKMAKVDSFTDDLFAAQRAFALAEDRKFPQQEEAATKDTEAAAKIPEDASELVVITKVKQLGAYVIAVTAKSPAKFRGVFVSRMQNFCLDAVQDLLQANFIRVEDEACKKQREKFQQDAIIKLKMLAYISMVAENAGCILPRQYKQISLQAGTAINLAAAWKKSDDDRWRRKDKEI